MSGKLQKEIGKTGPFASLEEEAMLNLFRTADRLTGPLQRVLKPSGLSQTQYNVLRILRGVSPKGLSCQEIARRMITRDADLTRLVDRLLKRELVARERQQDDRRVVHITITQQGLDLLAGLDTAVNEANKKALGHIPAERLQDLIDLLELARESAESDESLLT
jgi:DNA-binding MarR family transcriptional regulator